MAGDVRKRNSGTFDKTTQTWRIKGRGIQVSIRQLEKRYKKAIPPTKAGSVEFWRQYLQDFEDGLLADPRESALATLKEIADYKAMLARHLAANGPTARLIEAPDPPEFYDPNIHCEGIRPDIREEAGILGMFGGLDTTNEIVVGTLNRLAPAPPPVPKHDSLKAEADAFVARAWERNNKAKWQVKQAIDLFLSVTGDIPFSAVSVHHYRQFMDKVKEHPTWGERTRVNQQRYCKLFLKGLEADHGVTYPFVRAKHYNLPSPDGQKVQWTLDQVRSALCCAERPEARDVRMALLLGLNTGGYFGDIRTMTRNMLVDGHLVRCRAKNRHRKNPVVGSWLLWQETLSVLRFDFNPRRLQDQWNAFVKTHQLPDHKALRKTTTQVIEDQVGNREARLFRGEGGGDTHHKSYVKMFSPVQVAALDNAIVKAGEIFGIK